MGTGEFGAGVMYGFLACGSGLRMQELIGAIRTTTTTTMAGTFMRAIGIMRTMAITMMSTTVTRQMFCEEKDPAFRRVFLCHIEDAHRRSGEHLVYVVMG